MSNPSVQELFSLAGKTALITGATGHLGSAMAQALAEAGARVVVSSRHIEKAQAFANQLPVSPTGPHAAVQIDQTSELSLQRGMEAACEAADGIDILVNNAHQALGSDWTTVTGEQFQQQLANLTGYFLLARAFRDQAVNRQSGGSLIFIGSMYGVVGSYPDAYAGIGAASPVAYHALKGGIVQMTRHLAVYWAEDRIRVNCLSPGPFPSGNAPPEMVERLKAKSPMKRMGTASELKGAVVFLASEAASYVTGQNLVVDGGWTAW
ncbi:SDR family oxidoreductase [Planctomicrobium sp. SH664]|uniref:SDR family oxidoreductase n=1 Tax=Planctomicrobium sp. SH664 TaxID=3448125 RepID=UPI003F5C521D